MTDQEDAPCEMCKTPGAPSHEPSARCHYAAYGFTVTHCTCSACY